MSERNGRQNWPDSSTMTLLLDLYRTLNRIELMGSTNRSIIEQRAAMLERHIDGHARVIMEQLADMRTGTRTGLSGALLAILPLLPWRHLAIMFCLLLAGLTGMLSGGQLKAALFVLFGLR